MELYLSVMRFVIAISFLAAITFGTLFIGWLYISKLNRRLTNAFVGFLLVIYTIIWLVHALYFTMWLFVPRHVPEEPTTQEFNISMPVMENV